MWAGTGDKDCLLSIIVSPTSPGPQPSVRDNHGATQETHCGARARQAGEGAQVREGQMGKELDRLVATLGAERSEHQGMRCDILDGGLH